MPVYSPLCQFVVLFFVPVIPFLVFFFLCFWFISLDVCIETFPLLNQSSYFACLQPLHLNPTLAHIGTSVTETDLFLFWYNLF